MTILNKNNTVIIACATLEQELKLVINELSCDFPIIWIESGLHGYPEKLNKRIQEVMDNLDSKYETVLVLFGFCGNSMVGINPGNRTFAMPLTCDCIPIFLGSNKKREQIGAHTYFFTKGYLNSEQTIISENDYYNQKYGEKRAKRITQMMIVNYKDIAIIDTGAYDVKSVYDAVEPFAKTNNLDLNIVSGDLILIKDLVSGNWDDERFLVIEPNGQVTFENSLRAGQTKQII